MDVKKDSKAIEKGKLAQKQQPPYCINKAAD